jgi:hypothetical protein
LLYLTLCQEAVKSICCALRGERLLFEITHRRQLPQGSLVISSGAAEGFAAAETELRVFLPTLKKSMS